MFPVMFAKANGEMELIMLFPRCLRVKSTNASYSWRKIHMIERFSHVSTRGKGNRAIEHVCRQESDVVVTQEPACDLIILNYFKQY